MTGVWRHKVRLTLREDTAFAARVRADELPHRQLDAGKVRAVGEVRQVALIAVMEGRRGTAQREQDAVGAVAMS
jgi:hypothetical protein